MIVNDIMSKNVVSVSPDEPASLAARLLSRHNVGSLPVCSGDGKLHGIVTDRDIVLRCIAADSDPNTTPVKSIMSRSIITASPNDDIAHVSNLMSKGQVRRIPITDKENLVGIVSLGDLANQQINDISAGKTLSKISSNVSQQ